jgi:hypothetical protein
MTLQDLVEHLDLEVKSGEGRLETEVMSSPTPGREISG